MEPVPLSDIFVAALSEHAYNSAQDDSTPLEEKLSNNMRILRQGDTIHTTDANGSELSYRITMTEPVLQGYATRDGTQFVLTFQSADAPVSGAHQNGDARHEDSESGSEDLSIDEGFLAGSVLRAEPNRSESPAVNGGRPSSSRTFDTRPLSEPAIESHDDCTVFLRMADLGRIGVLEGDWVRTSPVRGAFRYSCISGSNPAA